MNLAEQQQPKVLWVWDNRARLSLSLGLFLWLGFLMITCLTSIIFLEHFAAQIVLGGFILSHLLVFGLEATRWFTIRRGFVSLTHVACWSPGLILTFLDRSGRSFDLAYAIWSYILMIVLFISLILDVRDSATYLYYLAKGKLTSSSP